MSRAMEREQGVGPGSRSGARAPATLSERLRDLERVLDPDRLVQLAWIDMTSGSDRTESLGATATGPLRPQEIDWPTISSLAAGEVRRTTGFDLRETPRLAAEACALAWARSRDRSGVLRIRFFGTPPGDALLLELADRVADWVRAHRTRLEMLSMNRERALGRRAGALVHDLRNRLTRATLELERARTEGGSLEELRSLLHDARELGSEALTDGAAGQAVLPVNLRNSLALECRAALGMRRTGRDVRLQTRAPDSLAALAQPTALRRLASNLILNAVEASPNNGRITVEGKRAGPSEVLIEVRDEGRGLSQERALQLFSRKPSQQADPAVEVGGTGFGTVSVVECLMSLEGELELDTTLGQGTLVSVTLPAAPCEDEPTVLVLDRLRERRRLRAEELLYRGLFPAVARTPARALGIVRGLPQLQRVEIARGTHGPLLHALMETCERRGIPLAATNGRSY